MTLHNYCPTGLGNPGIITGTGNMLTVSYGGSGNSSESLYSGQKLDVPAWALGSSIYVYYGGNFSNSTVYLTVGY